MGLFPEVTKERQNLYERMCKLNTHLENNIPTICGIYGRACRQMNDKADRFLCNGCTLAKFIATMDVINEKADAKEDKNAVTNEDFEEIIEELKRKTINADAKYVNMVIWTLLFVGALTE